MTVYTNALLEDYYIDEDSEFEFTDDLDNDVIIADPAFEAPSTASFFGFLRLALWQ